jgi:hypothetical protein
MCRPRNIPPNWIFVESWLDKSGIYTCATFAEPRSPFDSLDTQLMLEGFTIEALAGFDAIDVKELTYKEVSKRYIKRGRVNLLHGGKRKR